VAAKPPLDSIESLKQAISSKEKELGTKGRVLVRYSGTENKARVMVECEDEDACKRHAQELAEILEREIGVA
jgi:phosphoglucosamine mutase